MRLRGLVWLGIGVFLWIIHFVYGWPNLRWTRVPLGAVIAAIGAALIVYDGWAKRRAKPPDGEGSSG